MDMTEEEKQIIRNMMSAYLCAREGDVALAAHLAEAAASITRTIPTERYEALGVIRAEDGTLYVHTALLRDGHLMLQNRREGSKEKPGAQGSN